MSAGIIAVAVAALALVVALAAYLRADAALKRVERVERPRRKRVGVTGDAD